MRPASAASFSPRSGHRHSAQNPTAPAAAGVSSSLGPYPCSAFDPPLGSGFNLDPSLSGITIAAAGDSLRRACLDESALSPTEYRAYVPALLALQPAQSGIQGLYDEQSALHYLRGKCQLELHNEAMILSLFERTPLGIHPGHFYAWLRLVSWVQQGRRPSKKRLFTQTQPARTFTDPVADGPAKRMPAKDRAPPSVIFPRRPQPADEPSYDRQRPTQPPRHAARKDSKPKSHPKVAQPQPQPQSQLQPRPQPQPQPPRPPPTPAARSTNPFIVQPEAQLVNRPVAGQQLVPVQELAPEPEAEPASRAPSPQLQLPPARAYNVHPLRPNPAPALRRPDPLSVASSENPLPLDALIGINSAPNSFSKRRPRLVRPTPVVASAGTRDQKHPGAGGSPSPSWDWNDPSLQRLVNANANTNANANATGLAVAATAASRAPISPLIQAGLDAASQVQRAKLALPPKTYTTIQRSGPATSPLKPRDKPRRKREQPVGTGAGEGGEQSGSQPAPVPVTVGLVAPQPRRAMGAADPVHPQPHRSLDVRPEEGRGDTQSVRSLHSLRSSGHAAPLGAVKRSAEPMYPGIGDLLGSHLASLGTGGRPKSRSVLRDTLRDAPREPGRGREVAANGGLAVPAPHWLRGRDRDHAADGQSHSSSNPCSWRINRRQGDLPVSPRIHTERRVSEDRPQSRSPAPTLVELEHSASSNGAGNREEVREGRNESGHSSRPSSASCPDEGDRQSPNATSPTGRCAVVSVSASAPSPASSTCSPRR